MRSYEEDPCGGEPQDIDDDDHHNIHVQAGTMIDLDDQEQVEEEEEDNDQFIISQHFLELSSMLPGLPDQVDDASIIKRTIEQLEKLERDQANLLHELAAATRISPVDYNHDDQENDNIDINIYNSRVDPIVKVDMIMSNSLLITIHCKQSKWLLPRIAEEIIHKFHLSILNMSSFPLGGAHHDLLNITILTNYSAISHGHFNMEVIKNLQTALEALLAD